MSDAPRYLVSARKYRPQTFGSLVAQEHVAETLRNAVTSGRLAQAYLFSGPRGVGKTTAARILAKAVNCKTPVAQRPDAEPCGTCEACTSFDSGRAMNVIEIDAASHNGVDDMRELRETVRIPPQGARKKVYILDEVHMLSASAFNAILKTLEEPPEHALFIFATTEPHKVLPTILSRTQRFDFRRIAVPEIVEQLRMICAEEGFTADEDALVLIARRGDGAMRDALSAFDQAVALCGTALNGPELRTALGVVEEDLLFDTVGYAETGDRASLIRLVDGVVRRGHDLREFLLGVADHVRNLLVARATGDGALIEGTDTMRARVVEAAQAWAEPDLLHLLLIADEAVEALRSAPQPRLTVELALLRMASLEKAADLKRLLAHLEGIERRALAEARTSGAAAPQAAAPQAAAPQAAVPQAAAPQAAAPQAAVPQAAAPPQPSASAPAQTAPAPTAAPSVLPAPALQPPAAPRASVAPAPARPDATPVPKAPSAPPHVPEAQAPDAMRRTEAQAPPSPPPAPAPSHNSEPPAFYGSPPPSDVPPHGEFTSRPGAPRTEAPRDDSDDGGVPSAPPEPPRPFRPAPTASAPAPRPGGAAGLFGKPALSIRKGPAGPSGDGHAGTAPRMGASPAVADPFAGVIARIRDAWPALGAHLLGTQQIRLSSFLKGAQVTRVVSGDVEIALADQLGVDIAAQSVEAIREALAEITGEAIPALRFAIATRETGGEPAASADPFEKLKAMRQDHPVVRAVFERFGAEIVWQ